MRAFTACSIVAVCGLAVAAHAQPIEAIYTKISGHPTAVVPGAVDLAGAPAATDFRALEDLVGSPDGSHWLLKGRTQLGSDLETNLLLGSGATGTTLIQEGQPAVGGGFWDFIGSGVGRFNRADDFAFSARVRTNQSGTGAPPDAQRVLKWTQGFGLQLAFRQLDPYTGMQDVPANPSGDETVGNSVGSIHLSDEGVIGSQDSTINNIHTSRRPAIAYNRVMFHQTGVTTVTALGGLGPRVWSTIDANEFYTTPSFNSHWMAEGRVVGDGSNPRVLVRDGAAVLQEGEIVPGTSLLLGDIFQSVLAPDGSWVSRGRDNSAANQPDWAVRNGALVAQTGDPVFPGAAELWGDTLSAVTTDRLGNFAVSGESNAPSESNGVLIYNGTTVLVREGDPVDLDRNGQADDDAFIGRGNDSLPAFSPNNMFISEDGFLYFIANLRDAAGSDLNSTPAFSTPSAFLRVPTPPTGPTCDPDLNGDGNVDQGDVACIIDIVAGNPGCSSQDPDFNGDGNVDQDDVAAVITAVAGGGCP